ncbi:MAG TPA: sensor histidine kinase, partial [Candidatus Tectomicrobia bacterium]|nr:sensor histidine kinase [Candidatus Tectomicrobia bacterium]
VLMIWEESEEPWLHLAMWSHGGFDMRREAPETFASLVAEPLIGCSFLCPDVRATEPDVLYASPTGLQQWRGRPLHPVLQEEFAVGAVLSSGIHGTTFEGHILFLDMPELRADHLARADDIASQVASDLDQFYLSSQRQQAAVAEERRRLACNLHDGVLQSLAGISLQLTAVERLLAEDPQTAREHLHEVQRLIANEQCDLRFLVGELKSSPGAPVESDFCLAARVETMSRQIERQWGLRLELNMQLPERRIPTALAYEIYYIVHEALSNAARHAKASAVYVGLTIQDDHVGITVSDNGQGFPFHGRYDLATLTAMHRGPAMLNQRVASLGGSLTLESSEAGAHLDIHLPLLPPGDHHADPLCGLR